MRRSGVVGYALDLGSADSRPIAAALAALRSSLAAHGLALRGLGDSGPDPVARVVAASAETEYARRQLSGAHVALPDTPEAFALLDGLWDGSPATLAIGTDARGLAYALHDLADRVALSDDPLSALAAGSPSVQRPANEVRSVARLFVSDVEDKAWYHDRGFWESYFEMLSRHRFNRFHLSFGIGHDFLRDVRDAYFLFAYPFLLDVPGFRVRATGLPDEERERNLETLRFISDEAAARGLSFQLGLWTHGYRWHDSPRASHVIEGLDPERHAAYCRAALCQLLSECPSIGGLTLRVHGESGVPEGSHAFWREVFAGAAESGRRAGLDLHPKGLDRETIDLALATGLPVTLSPKFAAEHQSLPYHQAAIRGLERETRRGSGDSFVAGLMSRSGGDLRYTRYSYADFLAEDRPYGVLFRMWPGTRRLLLSGDPSYASALGRSARFCGSLGLDVMEPLSFKGRRGSGVDGPTAGPSRLAYSEEGLATERDFEKFEHTFRLLGRYLYDPDAAPDADRRYLAARFGEKGEVAERALSRASRILPLVTSAHLPSAANNLYWPEIYTNMPIADAGRGHQYGDSPSPKRFGTVSPLDPALFRSVEELAADVVAARADPRYSPLRVADWLEALSRGSLSAADELREGAQGRSAGGLADRVTLDVTAQALVGRFFADKLRAGVGYELFRATGERRWLAAAVERYRQARETWALLAEITAGRYVEDITFGGEPWLRGSWSDRLAGIDQDVADLEVELAATDESAAVDGPDPLADLDPTPPAVECRHEPAGPFERGARLPISLQVVAADGDGLAAWLHYRHVNQAEDYARVAMTATPDGFAASIPSAYADSPYPLLYFFELRRGGTAWLWPGLGDDLDRQPYFVARMLRSG